VAQRNFTVPAVTADHTLEVLFKAVIQFFTIHTSAGAGGSISPSGDVAVQSGADQTFVITEDAGFEVDQILLDGSPQPIPPAV
jgi:hypothetical protein